MSGYVIVKWLHVLLFGVWLGADYGTFLSSRFLLKADKSLETRATAAHMMVLFDLGPRLALVSMVPLGVTLARWSGAVTWGAEAMWAAWGVGLVWFGLVAAVELGEGKDWREPLRKIDLGLRSVVALIALATGISSLVGDAPFTAGWVALKVTIFGAIICSGIAIRFSLQGFSTAFGAIMTQGSSPEREQALKASLTRTYPFVGAIWLMVLAAGLLGVAKGGLLP